MSSQQAIMTLILSKLKPYILHDYLIVVSFWQNKQTRPRFLALANFIFSLPPKIPRDITFIPSILKLVQRWWVSWIMSIGHILNTLVVFPSCNSQENTIPKLLFATYLPTLQEKVQPSDSLLQLSEVENTLLAQCNRNPVSKALLLMHMARQAVTSRSHVGTEHQAQLLQVCRHTRVTCSF